MGAVYLIREEGTDHYKIGMVEDESTVKQRVARLQTGNPRRLLLLAVYEDEDPLAIERDLHRRFAKFRRHGEWFVLNGEATVEPDTCDHCGQYLQNTQDWLTPGRTPEDWLFYMVTGDRP